MKAKKNSLTCEVGRCGDNNGGRLKGECDPYSFPFYASIIAEKLHIVRRSSILVEDNISS